MVSSPNTGMSSRTKRPRSLRAAAFRCSATRFLRDNREQRSGLLTVTLVPSSRTRRDWMSESRPSSRQSSRPDADEAPPLERRLAAILAADVEGYSRLMHGDEEATMATLSAHRALVDELIARHRGRIANTAGDSVLDHGRCRSNRLAEVGTKVG